VVENVILVGKSVEPPEAASRVTFICACGVVSVASPKFIFAKVLFAVVFAVVWRNCTVAAFPAPAVVFCTSKSTPKGEVGELSEVITVLPLK
jgi:hypothetical protein